MILLRLTAFTGLVLSLAATCVGGAAASQLIDRAATGERLRIASDGSALVTYRARGQARAVRAWGARNALRPSRVRPQVEFDLRYANGAGGNSAGAPYTTGCRRYDGPPLAWLVAACTAPDGSYWAVQSWQRGLPNYGLPPTLAQAAPELRLSHWTGPVASLHVSVDWVYDGRFDHLYGGVTYLGLPVYGFRTTRFGAPLDGYGRNVYVDTLGSAYGAGWRRENGFLTHRSTGSFCYGFYPHGARPSGKGRFYRATVIGPGVTPDLSWRGRAPGRYDAAVDEARDARQARLGSDERCHA